MTVSPEAGQALSPGGRPWPTLSPLTAEPRDDPDEELSPFIDVDCQHPEAVLTPMPEGLSQQQVGCPRGRD